MVDIQITELTPGNSSNQGVATGINKPLHAIDIIIVIVVIIITLLQMK